MITIKELRKICQNSEKAPSWRTQSLEGRVNRIFSIYITWVFINFPITPNQITVFGTLVYLGGAQLFIFNNFNLHLVALGLLFFSFLLDACDGEIARYRKFQGAGVGGAYVEPVSHDVMYGLFFLPMGIGLSLASNNILPLIAAFIATAFKLIFRLAECRYELLSFYDLSSKGETREPATKKETPKNFSYFLYRNFFTGTGMFSLLIVAVIFNYVDYFIYFYAVSFFLFWCYKMIRQWKKIKRK